MSLDVAADVTSVNSLSFAGMVCIQNQHVMPQMKHVHPLAHDNKASSEFEFGFAIPENVYSPNISTGQLQKQANVLAPNQPKAGKQRNNGRSDIKEPSQDRCTRKANTRVKNGTDEKQTSTKKKIFKSFATPCRDCRAIEPTTSIKEPQLQKRTTQWFISSINLSSHHVKCRIFPWFISFLNCF